MDDRITILLSREHKDLAPEIKKCFKDLDVEINPSYTRLSAGDLPMQIIIGIGTSVAGAAIYDALKAGIKKLYRTFQDSKINVRDPSGIMFAMLKNEKVNPIVIPERQKEFSHIKNLDDLFLYLKNTNSQWKETTLEQIAYINPKEILKKGTKAKSVSMDVLSPFTRKINSYEMKIYSGGSKFRNGDTLMARITPCLENGKTALVDILNENEVGFGSTEFIVIREKPNISDKKFLYYFVVSPQFREAAIKSMTGTSGRQRVQTDLIANKTFHFPPLPEQRAIAAVLSSFDDKIELLRSQNQTLEALAQALFKEWFVDFNFPNASGKPYKKSGGKMVRSELGEIPEGWENDVLESFVTHIKEGINPQETPEKIFNHYSIPAFDQSKMPLLEKGKSIFSNKYIVDDNSFLVSKLNPSTPRIWTIFESKNGICSTEFQVLKAKKQEYFSFINCLLNSNYFTQELASKVQGTSGSHQRVKPEDILKVHFIIAKNNLLSSFNELVLPMLQKISKNSLQIQFLSILRDKLLPKLMTRVINLKSLYLNYGTKLFY